MNGLICVYPEHMTLDFLIGLLAFVGAINLWAEYCTR